MLIFTDNYTCDILKHFLGSEVALSLYLDNVSTIILCFNLNQSFIF